MKNQTISLVIGAVVLVVAGGVVVYKTWPRDADTSGTSNIACTMEAKACPDGSYVGRVAPTCQFAACPTATTTTTTPPPAPSVQETTLQTKIGQKVTGLGISITPLAVLEDSRCPQDVVCIQAGTVRVRTTLVSGLGTATQIFTLGVPVTTEAETITLTSVTPGTLSTKKITPSTYRFTFTVSKRFTPTNVKG